MQIEISARHGHLSDATQAKVRGKLDKLSRLFERITAIEATFDLQDSQRPGVHIAVSAEHKHDFVADHASDDMMGSLDQAIHKIEQQLRKYKEKIQDHHRGLGDDRGLGEVQ